MPRLLEEVLAFGPDVVMLQEVLYCWCPHAVAYALACNGRSQLVHTRLLLKQRSLRYVTVQRSSTPKVASTHVAGSSQVDQG